MKKTALIVVGVIVLAVLATGGFALMHHSSSKTPASTKSSSQNAPAVNNAVLVTKTDSKLGQYLADPSGKPLYTYNLDKSGTSNCTGECLSDWPIYAATGDTSNLPTDVGVITRSDNGQKQYTYKGLSLYYFTGDTGSSVTGNGIEDFAVATPSTSSSAGSSSTNSGSSSSSNSSSSDYNYNY